MAKIKINTDKVNGACNEIQKLAKDYNTIIEEAFNKIRDLQKDGVWIGQDNTSAVYKFINHSMKEKKIYSDYILELLDLSQKIEQYSKDIKKISEYKI